MRVAGNAGCYGGGGTGCSAPERRTESMDLAGSWLSQPSSATAGSDPGVNAVCSVLPLFIICPLKWTKGLLAYLFPQAETTAPELQGSAVNRCILGGDHFPGSHDFVQRSGFKDIWVELNLLVNINSHFRCSPTFIKKSKKKKNFLTWKDGKGSCWHFY